MSDSKVALCVGHSRRIDGWPEGGAIAYDGMTSEWAYNSELVTQVAEILCDRYDRHVTVENHYGGRGYTAAMKWLGEHLRSEAVDLAVEFHFNAAGPTANGHEWLHHHGSALGKLAAVELHLAMSRAFPNLRARGVKACLPSERGFPFLAHTACPAVIAEPFFGTNQGDWKIMVDQKAKLAQAMASGIHAFMGRTL